VLKRFVGTVVTLVLLALSVTVAVINRKPVPLVLDPFLPDNPVVAIVLPLWGHLLIVFALGAVCGWFATWFGQGKWRRMARQKALEAVKWKGEADRLLRERDQPASEARALTVVR
jgi:hypothetical protein